VDSDVKMVSRLMRCFAEAEDILMAHGRSFNKKDFRVAVRCSTSAEDILKGSMEHKLTHYIRGIKYVYLQLMGLDGYSEAEAGEWRRRAHSALMVDAVGYVDLCDAKKAQEG
jgi:hypothetical protein